MTAYILTPEQHSQLVDALNMAAVGHKINGAEGHMRHAQDTLAMLKAMKPQGWRPIETAPKDATPILIYCSNSRKEVQEAWWTITYEGDSGGHWQTPIGPNGRGYIILPTSPTHWMPLPDGPMETKT